ncbi:MAG TPA: glycosyltransferase family 39 protein [Streptosporangiaceae bacterium]|nr:glycosyltransferase family 39 protein [Streptosporangiaceae bacterium]
MIDRVRPSLQLGKPRDPADIPERSQSPINLAGHPDADTVMLPAQKDKPAELQSAVDVTIPDWSADEATAALLAAEALLSGAGNLTRPRSRTGMMISLLPPSLRAEPEPDARPAEAPTPDEPTTDDRPGPRRTRVSRLVLLALLVGQAMLTLRMHNTAFEDEALYLYSGHLELAHLLHGTPLFENFASYFSGAPVLYPVLAAVFDSIGGLAAARALSLAEMLSVTALLYSITRMLFNERNALCAAAIFAVSEATLFLGHLATYDATSVLLLAVATWIVVRTAPWRHPGYLLAALPAALAVATKYASLLFVPTVVVLSALAAYPYRGKRALIRPVALGAVIAGLLACALYVAGSSYRAAISFTTTHRAQGGTPASVIALDCLRWGAVPFAVALIGAIAYVWRARTDKREHIAPPGGRLRRAALSTALAGTALLAPAYQLHLHTDVSLQKHIGFGLLFAAPMAGTGLARIVGDHFRRAQIGILVWGLALTSGMTQAGDLFQGWPDSQFLVRKLAAEARPGAHYLIEAAEVPIYYLRNDPNAQPGQFTTTYNITYVGSHGQVLTGQAGFVAAIRAGYFRVVAYNYASTPALDSVLARTLESDPSYVLAEAIPEPISGGTLTYYIWVKKGSKLPASDLGRGTRSAPSPSASP